MFRTLLTLAIVCGVAAQPPMGPADRAKCPVTGADINITSSTPSVAFKNGQRLYFSTAQAATYYKDEPREFWLGPFDTAFILPGLDGKRGLPDLRTLNTGKELHCPFSNEAINVTMASPRVLHKWGQNLFFCCFGCITGFWADPASAFA